MFPVYEGSIESDPNDTEVELQIFPERSGGPAVEVVHLEQDADLAMLLDLFVHDRCKGFISFLRQFACDFDVQQLTD